MTIKSQFNWTEFIFEWRFEPSSGHILLHQLELGSAEPWLNHGYNVDDADWLATVTSQAIFTH